MSPELLTALALTTIAGLSTGLGSVIALFARRTSTRLLAFGLGFSAGVMLYVSFVELYPDGRARLDGTAHGEVVAVLCFLGGVVVPALIDFLVPERENPHAGATPAEMDRPSHPPRQRLVRLGLLTAVAIGIHNVPEGLATFVSALHDPALGLSIAVAVALHNVPEGISVAVPVYYATGDRWRAFRWSFLSGLSEPVGAIAGYAILRPFLDEAVLGGLLASVAGMMVFLSLDQLVPNAKKYDEGHESLYGILAGMAVMAFSLLLV